ncbi:TIGR03862 family flavoprotein [Neorhizobium galegae]|uniref:TIGR03862 family flavoprotein n=1 Tax=Neorhizobium galegae TaxID=399 RepID=UPI0012797D63|nr:NAD(P)/FAD-dependent oxidoreductase [Neorhizobium galegae]KAA9385441.1 NAD(P)/FAD-dependent oxidoreductase [Neorhizobium galegae]KAB1113090.1 NAD(P)/FAD-dependent oxidoreductase [Neorhizobium galegae]MCM2499343.1 NAD(P)/FAD-dependent oxidoreductase [Neorhizobium galegae]MCQ1773910.1 NAD(P)/FAD-dependent oxidoreductase [Neorhizobium galegae]MCQ1776658.1 NAD(P)/FAD-dependent oxidoreductase [Neorhizobium galegae]
MMTKQIAIIGGGPAGLMAAEVLSAAGHAVTVYEAMPTFGRKFLLAGKSGLNITHSEDFSSFAERFGNASPRLRPALEAFTPDDVRAWAAGLGTETFVGTSGRVFPKAMKASPLLRAWLRRLEAQGVTLSTRHRWVGFAENGYRFETPEGPVTVRPDAALLALGGASWPRLGSDAAWVPWLRDKGIVIADLRPANCGFDVAWSEAFRERFAGEPLKSVSTTSGAGTFQGEFVVSKHGIEGSLVYAHSAALRDLLVAEGRAALTVDLTPGRTAERLARDLARQDAKASFSNRLRKGAGLEGVKAALLRELVPDASRMAPQELAEQIKALQIPVLRPRPIAEAISSAGGIAWSDLDENYMLKPLTGLFAAGEMLDWEAPTGGYLLTACLATGRSAAHGLGAWLDSQ